MPAIPRALRHLVVATAVGTGITLAVPAGAEPAPASIATGLASEVTERLTSAVAWRAPKVDATDWTPGLRSFFVITDPAGVKDARLAVTAAGGTVFSSYDPIGVIVAHSADPAFATALRAIPGIQQVGATRTSDVPKEAYDPPIPDAPERRATAGTEKQRWDMQRIGATDAWEVNQGSADVVVGILDTGVDEQHPELEEAFDADKSVSCAYGKVDDRHGAWRDVHYHGTHVAGTVAAARDGKGMVGVAPGVRIASVRVAEEETTLFFPENTACAFMVAAKYGFDVTNHSYYTDPWQYNCPDDKDQAAIIEAIQRAADYGTERGVLHIASAGNSDDDLANKTTDDTSPDDSEPIPNRPLTNDCIDIPAELPGVVTVSAIGAKGLKSSYSNFGKGKIDLTAPGGDPGGGQDKGVYSSVPGGGYQSLAGTSMASPHVSGVAALLASINPGASPADLRALLLRQADDLPCPSDDDRCTGGSDVNSFYGQGQVDAAEAVGLAGCREPFTSSCRGAA